MMRDTLYFVTGNKDKYGEVQKIVPWVKQLDIDLPEIQEVDAQKIIKVKLEEAAKHHKGSFIVEDISLVLRCIKPLPGPLIKWFLKSLGNDGLFRLAKSLGDYRAEAKAVIGCWSKKGKIRYFDGAIRGVITAPRGDKGFGWDAIFQPEGHQKTFGEMEREEKNSISMRKIAYGKLRKYLEK